MYVSDAGKYALGDVVFVSYHFCVVYRYYRHFFHESIHWCRNQERKKNVIFSQRPMHWTEWKKKFQSNRNLEVIWSPQCYTMLHITNTWIYEWICLRLFRFSLNYTTHVLEFGLLRSDFMPADRFFSFNDYYVFFFPFSQLPYARTFAE